MKLSIFLKKLLTLWKIIFWWPALIINAHDAGYEYNGFASVCLSLGLVLPLLSLKITYFSILHQKIMVLFITYYTIGILSHFLFKSEWGYSFLD